VVTVERFAGVYERVMAPTFKPSAAKAVRSISRSYTIPTIGKYRLDEVTGQKPWDVQLNPFCGVLRRTWKLSL
jgi:hypothetical protein